MSTSPSPFRDESCERSESRMVRHQHAHSYSESGRISVPMWDSSDPDRAPPPLPLNPSLNGSPITKPNVSSNIEKAAALIASRALENAPSAYTSNPAPSSPEKDLIRPHHRRVATVQNGRASPSKHSDALERRSPEKGFRTSRLADFENWTNRTPEQSPTRLGVETPTPSNKRDESVEALRPSHTLQKQKSFENAPLADITNKPRGEEVSRPSGYDQLSEQISNVANIATSLQKELTALSRRSKDNSGDLEKLQQATKVRDEDIRNSLRELISGLDIKFGNIDQRLLNAPEAIHSTPNLPFLLDDHQTPSKSKGFVLPRITSPASFLASELGASPSVVSVDGAASIAMLEKVLREMATKDGQDKLMNTMEFYRERAEAAPQNVATKDFAQPVLDASMMQKLEEILVFMKDMKSDSGSKALVRASSIKDTSRAVSQLDSYLDGENKGSNTRGISNEAINEEVAKTLRSVKQSLSQHGGLTNEVKALVRELRGEVLGMGREIAKKLDENAFGLREIDSGSLVPAQQDVVGIVKQSMLELKEHIHAVVQENNMQLAQAQPAQDNSQVVEAMTRALSTHRDLSREIPRDTAAEREEMIAAVREAWEECKPEISMEHFGLERDEILDTLKEGLQSYQPQEKTTEPAVTQNEVLEAVQKALADYQPPQIQPMITHDDIARIVAGCLQQHEFPLSNAREVQQPDHSATRELMLGAVTEGLANHVPPTPQAQLNKAEILDVLREGLEQERPSVQKEVEFNREDLFDAVKSCLEGENNPLGGMGERVVEAMHEFTGSMKNEFQQYSSASGRDTEQVLDAMKDGMEELRSEIESYVDRAADVTGKDEIIDSIKAGFAAMQVDMEKGFQGRSQQDMSTPELLDAMEKEFEHLRETMRKTLMTADMTNDKTEILEAIREISDHQQASPRAVHLAGNEDVAQLVKDELERFQTTLVQHVQKPVTSMDRDDIIEAVRETIENTRAGATRDGNESVFSNTSELLDAFQDGVDSVRADMKKLIEKTEQPAGTQELLDSLTAGIESIRTDIQDLKTRSQNESAATGKEVAVHDEEGITNQINAVKVMLTQLHIKIEAMSDRDLEPTHNVVMPTTMRMHEDDLSGLHEAMAGNAQKHDLESMHEAIRGLHETVNSLPREIPEFSIPEIKVPEVVMPVNAATKEDTDAIETLLFNLKAKVDDMVVPNIEGLAQKDQLMALEEMLGEVRSTITEVATRPVEQGNKEDFTIMELKLQDIASSIESLHEKATGTTRGLDGEANSLTKTDLEVLEGLCFDVKAKLEEQQMPAVDMLASKGDLIELKDTLTAFREQFESDNDLTAQAFEARKIEHGGLATKIDEVKSIAKESREEIVAKLANAEEGLSEISRVLGMHHDDMNTYATSASITELTDLVTKAFDAHLEYQTKDDAVTEERNNTLFNKYDEQSAEFRQALDEKFSELMNKYDDAQVANNAKLTAMQERDSQHAETNANMQTTAADVKIIVSSMDANLTSTCEKIAEDSRVVFDIVDQSNMKLDTLTGAIATEHSLTREEISKTLDVANRLEGNLAAQQPELFAAIKELLDKVSEHYQQSQKQADEFKNSHDEIKTSVRELPIVIPTLLPALPEKAETVVDEPIHHEKYGDVEVHKKLDDLLEHSQLAKEAFGTMDSHHSNTLEKLLALEKLSSIEITVNTTAQQISTMVATQTKLMLEHADSQAEEARASAIAFEKRLAQREHVEAELVNLAAQKNELLASMAALRHEHEELASQTKRLSRDVGKLETALAVRQQEMHDMNTRAESLERRVLEGVVNHARTLASLRGGGSKKRAPRPSNDLVRDRDASMNLKRVPSNASASRQNVPMKPINTLGSVIGMALKKRGPTQANTSNVRQSVDRRILSTSHMQNTKGMPQAMIIAPTSTKHTSSGLGNLKRSQSVKSNPSGHQHGRKPSWTELGQHDKENDGPETEEVFDEEASEAGTERRTSIGGTSYMYTDSDLSKRTTSRGSNIVGRRSLSYASHASRGSLPGGGRESILEEDEEEDETAMHDLRQHHDEDIDDEIHPNLDPEREGSEYSDSDADSFEDADTIGDLPVTSHVNQKHNSVASYADSALGSEVPTTPDVSVGNRGSNIWSPAAVRGR